MNEGEINENLNALEKSVSGNELSEFEEETRSIVYGNPIRNKYGNFRCYCAAVSNKGNIIL